MEGGRGKVERGTFQREREQREFDRKREREEIILLIVIVESFFIHKKWIIKSVTKWLQRILDKIHQGLLSQFSLLAEFFIRKVLRLRFKSVDLGEFPP